MPRAFGMPSGLVRGGGGWMKGPTPSTTHAISVVAGAAIRNGAALAPRGQDLKRSGATCMMRASLGISVCPTTSSSMMATHIPMFGWRTTASRVGRVGRTMTSSSSNSSLFTWLTHPELGSITFLETRLIVGRILRRSSPATFMAHP
jgi:hypothetical protein